MKENRHRRNIAKPVLSVVLAIALVIAFMPVKEITVKADTTPDTITVEVDNTSTYRPTQIVNGDFSTRPFMKFVVGSTTYNSWVSTSTPSSGTAISSGIPNGVDGGWNTTETQVYEGCLFEWTKADGTYGLTGSSGYYIEMNAYNPSTLYQDLSTHSGDVILWTLRHAARKNNGTQAIKVEIGASDGSTPFGTGNSINTHITTASKAEYTSTGVSGTYGKANPTELSALSIDALASNNPWKTAKGVYIVPDNQNVTRFAFISTVSNNLACGNMLDDITFSTLIGNLEATLQNDGSVKLTGYWGDVDTAKKLKIAIGGSVKDIDMSSVCHKNFVITIPASMIGTATSVEVYHQDYAVAKRTIAIEHVYDATINAKIKLQSGSDVPTSDVMVTCTISAVTEGAPMPSTPAVSVALPKASDGTATATWHISGLKVGTYRYKIVQSSTSGYVALDDKPLYAVVTVAEDGTVTVSVTKAITDLSSSGAFILNKYSGEASYDPGTVTVTLGSDTQTVVSSSDAFNIAMIKSSFAIDFTKNFVMSGTMQAGNTPDGSLIGFVPSATPANELTLPLGGYLGVYGNADNKNGIFLEFDTFDNGSNDICGDQNISGMHFALMKTGTDGKAISTPLGYTTCNSWPTGELNYTIKYENSKLTFVIYKGNTTYANYSVDNPTSILGTNEVYLILAGALRYGPSGSYGLTLGSASPKTQFKLSTFEYSADGTVDQAFENGYTAPPVVSLGSSVLVNGNSGKMSYPNATVSGTVNKVMITVDSGSFSTEGYTAANQDLTGLSKTYNVSNAAEAQALLRSMVFSLATGKDSQKVTVSLSGDVTDLSSLPSYANITITQHNINGVVHYYAYVTLNSTNSYNNVANSITFADAYAAAKKLKLNGLQGYLATITSAEENQILDNITPNMGWGGGGRVNQADAAINGDTFQKNGSLIAPSSGSTWYWVCGPEAGNAFTYGATKKQSPWSSGEPNGSGNGSNAEYLLMLHFTNGGWNDIPNATYKLPGYFVEWSEDTRAAGESALYCEATVTNSRHVHNWVYVAGTGENANKLYAYCDENTQNNCGFYGTSESHANALTLTINIDAKTYDGTALAAVYGSGEAAAWKNTIGTDAPAITYEKKVNGTWTAIATAPSEAGEYRVVAKISDTAVVYKELSINPVGVATVTFTLPTVSVSGTPASDASLNIPDTANYTGTISWSTTETTFKYNTVYTATITLTAKSNYAFANDVPTPIGWTKSDTSTSTSLVFTKTFDRTPKAKITSVTVPSVTSQLSAFTTESAQKAALPATIAVVVEDGSSTSMSITWTLKTGTTYDATSDAENTFVWTVTASEYANYNINDQTLTGEVTLKNPHAHSYGTTGDDRFTCTVCHKVDTVLKTQVEAEDAEKAAEELAAAKKAAKKAIDDQVPADAPENVKAAAEAAKRAIDEATTVEDVTTAKTEGTTEVEEIKAENKAEEERIEAEKKAEELADAKEAAKKAIDDQVPADAPENVKAAAEAAKRAIDEATTIADVTTAKSEGTTEVEEIKAENKAEEERIEAEKKAEELAEAKEAAKKAIDDQVPANAPENVKAAAEAAKAAIDSATSVEAVNTEKTEGTTTIVEVKAENNVGRYEGVKPDEGVVEDITGTHKAEKESNPFNATIENDDFAAMIGVTEEERAEGVTLWLEVVDASETMPEVDKNIITEAKAPNAIVGMFVDASMFMKVGNGDSSAVHELNSKVKVSLVVPEALRKTGRKYTMVRAHDGVATVIEAEYDEASYVLSFETDRFSSYAIVYEENAAIPQTSLSSDAWIIALIMIMALAVYFMLERKRRAEK